MPWMTALFSQSLCSSLVDASGSFRCIFGDLIKAQFGYLLICLCLCVFPGILLGELNVCILMVTVQVISL